ncbi:MAG: hypothetical protein IPM80_09165 [Proteobacteria bacterium]|nr:hypothetical protein [Pseudomonadota bacterium]
MMVGFQRRGTLGRALVDGALHPPVGETIRVNAKVHTLGGFSAHADQGELSRWYGHFQHKPRLVLVHGEASAQQALVQRIEDDHGVTAHIAARGESPHCRRTEP